MQVQSTGQWYDVTRDPPPMNKVLALRDHRQEWFGMNRLDGATQWSFIR